MLALIGLSYLAYGILSDHLRLVTNEKPGGYCENKGCNWFSGS